MSILRHFLNTVLICSGLAMAAESGAAAPYLKSYRCSIVLTTAAKARLRVDFALSGIGDHHAIEFKRIIRGDVRIGNLAFFNRGGALGWQSLEEGAIERYRLVAPARDELTGTVEYEVQATGSDGMMNVPLLVPGPPCPPESRGVDIEANLGPGMVVVGDTFPRFSWPQPSIGRVTMGNVPSFVRVRIRKTEDASLIYRMLDTTFLNDVAIVLLLLGGSAGWWMINRKRQKV
jgi:hypothetical protein